MTKLNKEKADKIIKEAEEASVTLQVSITDAIKFNEAFIKKLKENKKK